MYQDEAKSLIIPSMFSKIARRYDLLNTLFSLGMDRAWRRRALSIVLHKKPRLILDVATGTGKFAIEAKRQSPDSVIFATDPSIEMLSRGRSSTKEERTSGLNLTAGIAEALPFADESFDCVTVAFGLRNFMDLNIGIKEIFRVLKQGGSFVALEFSMPDNIFLRFVYGVYLGYFIPWAGMLLSKSRAYFYLRDTIRTFPRDGELVKIIESLGFTEVRFFKFSSGVVSCYSGTKPHPT